MNAMQWIGGVDLVAIIEQYKRNIIHQINQLLPVPLPEHEFTTERVESMIVSIRKQLERQPQHQRLQMPTHLVPGPLPFNGPFPVQPMMPVNVPVQTIYNTDAFSHVEPSSNMWSKEMLSRRNEDGIHQLYPSHSFVCSTCAWRFDQREKLTKHLDWHFQKRKEDKKRMAGQLARNWWPGSTEWTTLGADEFHSTLVSACPFDNPTSENKTESKTTCVALATAKAVANKKQCGGCHEALVLEWCEDDQDWIVQDAVQIGYFIYHLGCIPSRNSKMLAANSLKRTLPSSCTIAESDATPLKLHHVES